MVFVDSPKKVGDTPAVVPLPAKKAFKLAYLLSTDLTKLFGTRRRPRKKSQAYSLTPTKRSRGNFTYLHLGHCDAGTSREKRSSEGAVYAPAPFRRSTQHRCQKIPGLRAVVMVRGKRKCSTLGASWCFAAQNLLDIYHRHRVPGFSHSNLRKGSLVLLPGIVVRQTTSTCTQVVRAVVVPTNLHGQRRRTNA